MAYVTGFDHDVFISFTHDDNQPVAGPDGWITLFEQTLSGMLRQRLPEKRPVQVWRDPQLNSNDVLGATLDSTVARTAVLVCIVSPRYLRAEWCRRELKTFWESRHRGFEPKLGERLRVFKVLVQDPDEIRNTERTLDGYPKELCETLGKPFFDRQPPKPDFTQLAWPRGLYHEDQRFQLQMERLAGEIASQLESMRKIVDAKDQGFDDSEKRKGLHERVLGPIYLAEATEDLDDDRYKLKQELERQGVWVLPEDTLSNKRDEAEQEIRKALEASQFAVHLFSDTYGRALRGDKQMSLPHLQYQLSRDHAAARGSKKFERLVWIPDSLDHAALDAPQREFLGQLEHEPDTGSPVDIQKGSLQRLKESILKRLTKPVRPSAPKSRRALIYVTGQPPDMITQDATKLVNYLKRDHDVFKSPTTDDDERRQKQHEKYCQQSDGLVLLYGSAPPDWVQDKALDIRAMSERRREKPLAAAVYEAPPADKEELEIHFENVVVVDGRKGFDPDNLRPFLDRVDPTNESSSNS